MNNLLHVVYVSTSRNITLTLDEETLREARVLAAERGLSVSAFLRRELAGIVERQRGYNRARDSAVRRLRRGAALGAMVVQAAIEAGCDTLYSEDLNAGQRFGSVVVVNPFKQR